MPLVANEPVAKERPPWRGVVVGIVAAFVFIVVLAVSAHLTRDTPHGVPPHPRADAGLATVVDNAIADAGVLVPDGGTPMEVQGPATEPDSGPILVAGPPVAPNEVGAAVLPIVHGCLKAALRFDPGLGGTVRVQVIARRHRLAATLVDSPSPVLASCVADKGRAIPFASAPAEPLTLEARFHLDGLRAEATLVGVDLTP